jgi:polysaccharide export outer membrane protein
VRAIKLLRTLLAVILVMAVPAIALAQAATPPLSAPAGLPPIGTSAPAQAGVEAPPPSSTPTTSSAGDRSYALGVGDIIDVSILGQSEFNTHARVGTDGAIVLPLIGAMQAINRSPGQLADEVRAALQKGGYYAQPLVRVEVVGVSSRFVTIMGAVGSAGLMPLDRQYHLSEIMAKVGGKGAGGADYLILTHSDAKSERFKIADLGTATGDKDPIVQSGDKIYVPNAENSVFYVTGAVKGPGAYPASDDLTLRMALARAGGLGDSGSEKKISIHRDGKDIKAGNLDETKVQSGDIIKVGEKLF